MTNEIIIKKFKEHFNEDVTKIIRLTNGLTNEVYKVNDNYVIKVIKSKHFPEKGKLVMIQKQLENHDLGAVKNLVNVHRDNDFEYGYVIQEYINGKDALTLIEGGLDSSIIYKKLGEYMKKVHSIRFDTFGYLGDGVNNFHSFEEFIEDDLNGIFKKIDENKILKDIDSIKLKKYMLENLKLLSKLPATLCHNDIRLGNILVKDDKITLVDWDNSLSTNWIQDYSRMTYEALTTENIPDFEIFKDVFLKAYKPNISINELEKFESIYHLRDGLRKIIYPEERIDKDYDQRIKKVLTKSLDE